MLYIEKLRRLMGVSYFQLSKLLNLQKTPTCLKFKKKRDFTIPELIKLRDKFAEMGLISDDFDIGDLLNEVEDDTETSETTLS